MTPERGVRAVDGLLTGWHEPEASHLQLLEAVAGRRALELAYAAALAAGLPLARVRRRPPDPARPRRCRRTGRSKRRDEPGVSVAPPVSAAQRSVLYAVRRRGEATVADVAERST